jgi:quinoprotein glucose dehydrogenase
LLSTSIGFRLLNTRDSHIRAYDAENGKELWSVKLPSGTVGFPTLYEVNGREYLAVSAPRPEIGGRGIPITLGSSTEHAYVVFVLPKETLR